MSKRGLRDQFRIIGGRWRGRKVSFDPVPGLRPTPDRVRETLFNWLQPVIHGARCLDLFAGSGSLGLEALSRGAGEVVFVDQSSRAVARLEQTLTEIGVSGARVHRADALKWLATAGRRFDVIFADPPFESDCLARLCTLLEEIDALNPRGRLYVEFGRGRPVMPPVPWQELRSSRAGQVAYGLWQKKTTDAHSDSQDKQTDSRKP